MIRLNSRRTQHRHFPLLLAIFLQGLVLDQQVNVTDLLLVDVFRLIDQPVCVVDHVSHESSDRGLEAGDLGRELEKLPVAEHVLTGGNQVLGLVLEVQIVLRTHQIEKPARSLQLTLEYDPRRYFRRHKQILINNFHLNILIQRITVYLNPLELVIV